MATSNDFIREVVGERAAQKTVLFIGYSLSGIARTWEDRGQNVNTVATIQGTNDLHRGRVNARDNSVFDENNQLVDLSYVYKKRTSGVSGRRFDRLSDDRNDNRVLTGSRTTPYFFGNGIMGSALNSNRPLTCVPICGLNNVDLNCFARKYFSRVPHPCAFSRVVKSLARCLNATISSDLSVSRPTVLNCRYEIRPRKRCSGGLHELIERQLASDVQLITGVDPTSLTVSLATDGRFVVRHGDEFIIYADEVYYNLDPAQMALSRAQMTKTNVADPNLGTYHSTFLVDIGSDAVCSVLGSDVRSCTPDPDGSIFTVAFAASGGENSLGPPCMSGTVSVFTRFDPFALFSRTGLIPDGYNFDCSRQVLVHVEMTDLSYRTSLVATQNETGVGTPIPSLQEYISSLRRAAGVVRCVRQAFGVDTLTLTEIVEEIRQENVDGTYNLETRLDSTPLIAGASYNWLHEVNDYFGLELFGNNELTRGEVPNVTATILGR